MLNHGSLLSVIESMLCGRISNVRAIFHSILALENFEGNPCTRSLFFRSRLRYTPISFQCNGFGSFGFRLLHVLFM